MCLFIVVANGATRPRLSKCNLKSPKLQNKRDPMDFQGHIMNSMKLVIPLHTLYWSIHTKDESKRGTVFAFIFGVN